MKTIFVSSTFRDMQNERDAIQNLVAPMVNEVARQYGDSVSFCDLRWGIDTSELESDDSAQKVLNVCLDEIDRCQNPMIVIMGERYGWIPEKGQVAQIACSKNLELDDLTKSVTALEIEYGAFRSESRLQNTLFYVRHVEVPFISGCEAEDEEHDRLQKQLKKRAEELSLTGIREYTLHSADKLQEDIRRFAGMLAADIISMLMPEWKQMKELTRIGRENNTHFRYFEEKAQLFQARQYLLPKYRKLLEENQLTVLKGAPGSGKSTLMAALVQKLREEGKNVVACECALTSSTSTSQGVLSYLVDSIDKLEDDLVGVMCFDDDDDFVEADHQYRANSFEEYRLRLAQLCNRLPQLDLFDEDGDKHLYIVIDGCDQLIEDEFRNKLHFLPGVNSKYLHIIVSCIEQMKVQALNIQTFSAMTEDAEKQEMVSSILRNHRRELQQNVVREILKKKGSDNPLYLSMLVQRLLMMNQKDFAAISALGDGMDAISAYQISLIRDAAEEVQRMGAQILEVAAEQINANTMHEVVDLLGFSEKGLRVEDLKKLVPGFQQLDFSNFISLMQENFIRREDGRFDFSHASIRSGIQAGADQNVSLEDRLYQHFAGLATNDELQRSQMLYHCINSSFRGELRKYMLAYDPSEGSELPKALVRFCVLHTEAEISDLIDFTGTDADAWIFYNTHLIPAFGEAGSEQNGREKLLKVLEQRMNEKAFSDVSTELRKHYIRFTSLIGGHYYGRGDLVTAKSYYQEAVDWLTEYGITTYSVEEYIEVLYAAYHDLVHAIAGNQMLSKEEAESTKNYLRKAQVLALTLYHRNVTEENTLRLCDLWILYAELFQATHFAFHDFVEYAKDSRRNESWRKDSVSYQEKALELMAGLQSRDEILMRQSQCETNMGCIKEYMEERGMEKAEEHFRRAQKYLEQVKNDSPELLKRKADILEKLLRVEMELHPDKRDPNIEKLFEQYIEYRKMITAMVQDQHEFEKLRDVYRDKAEYYLMLTDRTYNDICLACKEGARAREFTGYMKEVLGLPWDYWRTEDLELTVNAVCSLYWDQPQKLEPIITELKERKAVEKAEDRLSEELALAYAEVWEMLQVLGSDVMAKIPLYRRKMYFRYGVKRKSVLQDDHIDHMSLEAQKIFAELNITFIADVSERYARIREICQKEEGETPWFLSGLDLGINNSAIEEKDKTTAGQTVKKKKIIFRTVVDPVKIGQYSLEGTIPKGTVFGILDDPTMRIQGIYEKWILRKGVQTIEDVIKDIRPAEIENMDSREVEHFYRNLLTYDDGSGPLVLEEYTRRILEELEERLQAAEQANSSQE
ncbi:MAG: DUF4062 domain-containing protein [Acetatifactor sp.]|nr:DUF4062 domain-containing protein [Acetatifactor sp.]